MHPFHLLSIVCAAALIPLVLFWIHRRRGEHVARAGTVPTADIAIPAPIPAPDVPATWLVYGPTDLPTIVRRLELTHAAWHRDEAHTGPGPRPLGRSMLTLTTLANDLAEQRRAAIPAEEAAALNLPPPRAPASPSTDTRSR